MALGMYCNVWPWPLAALVAVAFGKFRHRYRHRPRLTISPSMVMVLVHEAARLRPFPWDISMGMLVVNYSVHMQHARTHHSPCRTVHWSVCILHYHYALCLSRIMHYTLYAGWVVRSENLDLVVSGLVT